MKRTHLLEQVAENYPVSKQWLRKKIRAGQITAHKLGRHWVMTDDDIEQMLETFSNRANVRDIRPTGGLSAASLRRRSA